jgi:hypothetical protein
MVCARDSVDDDISTHPSTLFFQGPVIEKKEVKNLFDYRCRKKIYFVVVGGRGRMVKL